MAILLALLMLAPMTLLAGCGEKEEPAPSVPLPSLSIEVTPPPMQGGNSRSIEPSATLLGFITPAAQDEFMRIAQHGFLRTAETLGYPAKLYTGPAAQANNLIDAAVQDGCAGLLVWDEGGAYSAAISKAKEAGVQVVVPFFQTDAPADANLYTDETDYIPEAVRIFCEAIGEKGYAQGTIVLVCGDEKQLADALTAQIRQSYPQYLTQTLPAANANTQEAVTAFVLDNPDVLGVFVLDAPAGLWPQAKKDVEEQLKSAVTTTPTAKPTPTPAPSASAEPGGEATPAPTGQLNPEKRDMVIAALDYSQENIALVRSGSIYALLARPYFDATAQATMMLDRLLRGQSVQQDSTLNVPLIRSSGIEKYASIASEAQAWFTP